MIKDFLSLNQLHLNIAILASIFIIAASFWIWWRKPHSKFPPGPRGIPLFGVLPWLSNYPERKLKKWSQKHYGPVMSARFGMEDVVILNTFDAVQQALVKQGSDFSGRPRIKLYTQVLGDNGILFADYDKKFRSQKKFLVNVLKRFGQGKRKMEILINEESDYFIDFMKSYTGKPYHMLGNDLQNLIGNVICRLTFGRRFDYNDPTFRKVFDILKDTYSDPKDASSIATLIFFYDYVKNLPPFAAINQKIIQSEIDMMAGILPLIQEHKESFDENQIRDYIDAFIYEQKFGKNPDFSDDQLMIAVRDVFAAGTETVSSTVNWLVLALLTYPEHQKKIVEEIDRVFGQKEWPSMSKRNQTPFTCAFIQEVQRYCPPVPLSLTHITQNDVEFAGYSIPNGTKVIPNIWGVHFDAKLWVDPYKFDPYRHIDSENQFMPSNKIIPFGVGPRFCPGESLARVEIFLVLVKILQKFTISGTGDRLPSLLSGLTTIVHSARRFEVVFHAR